MKNNKGATLIELLAGIAVAAVVSGLIGVFLIFSTRTYGKVTEEADMQENAQILLSQLNNYIIDTDASLRYFVDTTEGGSGVEVLSDDLYAGNAADLAEKRLDIYKRLEDGVSRETITWRKSTYTLTYRKEKIDSAGDVQSEISEQELSGYVRAFGVDLTETASLRQVGLELELEQEDRSYEADAVVYLRNQPAVNREPDAEIYTEPVVSSVLNVKVLPQTVTLRPGSRRTFLAVVYGTNSPSQEVTWSMEGNSSPLTLLNPQTGVLWVATNEKSSLITVRATSVQDPTKSAAAQVTVLQDKKLSLGTIRKYWLYQDADMYIYGRVNGTLSGTLTWECHLEGSDVWDYKEYGVLESDSALESMNARLFHGWYAGTYTITIKGTVDGDYFEDTVTVEVIPREEYNIAGNGTYVQFSVENGLHYWVQPGETVNLSTVLLSADLGTVRTYAFEEFGDLDADSYTWGSYGEDQENLWVKISDTALPGDIRVKAIVQNEWATGYDTITIHVAYPYSFPYVAEAVNIPDSNNYFWERNSFRGPVKLASDTSELTDLSEGIESLVVQNGGYDQEISAASWKQEGWDLSGVTHLDLSGEGTLGSGSDILLSGVIVSEGNLDLSSGGTIRTTDDTIIYVKGEHTVKLRYGKVYFDGVLYAPEGTVYIAASSGFCRGVIIAKNIEIIDYGNACFSVMEKQSVMDLVNSIKQ